MFTYTSSNSFILDNVVVCKLDPLGETVRLTPTRLLDKQQVDYSHLQMISFGSRLEDNKILNRLVENTIRFNDLLA